MFIVPYKLGSDSAIKLSQSLNIPMYTRPKYTRSGLVINWGRSSPFASTGKILNHPLAVKVAVNKLSTFEVLKRKNIDIPDFTTDYATACQWIEDGEYVVARQLLESHSGQGITICKTVDELPRICRLYVKYFKKTYEFRVHIFNNEVIDYVQKKKRDGLEDSGYNKYVRCHGNGWVFCRDDIHHNDGVKKLAIKAVNALHLDFAAVDVVMKSNGECKILEVNTSPALENTTLESYKNAILNCKLE